MPKKNSKSLYLAALVLFLGGIGYLLFSGFAGGSVYFIDVAEALAMSPDKPQPVRLFGKVKAEGIAALEEGVGVRFQLEDKVNATNTLWVTFRGAVPDAFSPGAEVIIEGVYAPDLVTVNDVRTMPAALEADSRRDGTQPEMVTFVDAVQHKDFEAKKLMTQCPSKYKKKET